MASNVNILCPNGRRQTIKVSPNTRILEVIETVCQKQKFNPDEYNLKHQRTVLDVQVPFRYANLPNNAKLELVKSDRPRSQSGSTVVALQLSSGERLQRSFDSSMSLWELLQHWEGQGNRPSLLRPPSSSDGPALHPVCIYMREEIIGEEWLKATTLKGLGLTGGKAIIRLLHRDVELPPPPPKPAQPKSKLAAKATSATPSNTPSNQVVSSGTSSYTEVSGQVIDANRGAPLVNTDSASNLESNPIPLVTIKDSEMASAAHENEAVMDSAIPDNRGESQMEIDAVESESDTEVTESQARESEELTSLKAHIEERTNQRSVRPKDEPRSFGASTSVGEGEGTGEQMTENVVKGIEKSSGLNLDEYARRRIKNLLEKEEEMVQSMQTALMESIAQQTKSTVGQSRNQTEVRRPVQSFADFKFPETNSSSAANQGKGKKLLTQEGPVKPCDRNQLVFSLDQEPLLTHGPSEVPDEFFDVTVDDVRRMLSDLRHQSAESGKELETKAMREAREQLKMRKYEKVVVRVHFPDRIILQGFFRPQETVEAVREFVKSNLSNKEQQFYLYTTPPKTILKDTSLTLFKAKLFPAAMVYFGTQDPKDQYIREDALGDLATLLQAESVVAKNMNTGSLGSVSRNSPGASTSAGAAASSSLATSDDPMEDQGSTSTQQKRQASPSGSAVGSTKVPKWFKMGKK